MKTLIAVVALVSAVATSGWAQTTQQQQRRAEVRQQHVVPPIKRHSANPTYDVYAPDGTYVGSDPDPSIRSKLWFDSALQGLD